MSVYDRALMRLNASVRLIYGQLAVAAELAAGLTEIVGDVITEIELLYKLPRDRQRDATECRSRTRHALDASYVKKISHSTLGQIANTLRVHVDSSVY